MTWPMMVPFARNAVRYWVPLREAVSPTRVIEAVFRHELDAEAHRNDVLYFVNKKFRELRTA